jgi:hypothetical protein
MTIRRVSFREDYPVIKTWWEKRGSEAPQLSLLPPLGIVCHLEGVLLACAFMYEVKGAPIAIVEWEATNPEVQSALMKIRALNHVFAFYESYCDEREIKVLLSWVASERGDGRLLQGRHWKKCPGERHELMAFETEAPCPQS